MKPNKSNKMTKKFLATLENGTFVASNCIDPGEFLWEVNDNYAEIFEEAKSFGLNNRLCHTFEDYPHFESWYANLMFPPKRETSFDDDEEQKLIEYTKAVKAIEDCWSELELLGLSKDHDHPEVGDLALVLNVITKVLNIYDPKVKDGIVEFCVNIAYSHLENKRNGGLQ